MRTEPGRWVAQIPRDAVTGLNTDIDGLLAVIGIEKGKPVSTMTAMPWMAAGPTRSTYRGTYWRSISGS
jgi:hypothetical protein